MPHKVHMTGYQCIACAASQPVDFSAFLCPVCGGNLDIRYDYDAVSATLSNGFDEAADGVFRYRALLPVAEPENGFPLRIGATPLYRADRLGRQAGLNRLYLKDDSPNPSASFKDRASVVALCRAQEVDADVVATASTGNAGSSMACLAAAMGLDAVVFVPRSAPAAKLAQLRAYGARVLAVRGNYDAAFDLCLAATSAFGWYNRSTGFNPFSREGKKTCAFEIWEDLGREVPDRVIVPTGDGNIISGIWKGWRELQAVGLIDRLPKIDCVQSERSAAVCRTVRRLRASAQTVGDVCRVQVEQVEASTAADSICVDRPRDGLAAVRAVMESGGAAVTVEENEIATAAFEMARLAGVFPEPAAAVPWAAVKRMADAGELDREETVVCLVTGSGLKDVAVASSAAPEPVVIEAELRAVERAIAGEER
ncbi:MAG: threonine synthase [Xanthomonadales bacterium]|nr:threonine synthase [Xanthomonadales bacterium]